MRSAHADMRDSRAGMKLLEKYILRRVGQMFLVALLPVLAIIWTTQVLARINLVTDSGQSIGSFMKLATLILPTIIPIVLPFALVIGITQTLAAELAPKGINVNAICPGTIVATRMRDEADKKSIEQGLKTAKERESGIPVGRVGLPEDIARVAVFLASEESSYMTGQSINVTGGLWMH